MRISKMTDYSVIILTMIARKPCHQHTCCELTKESGLGYSTVAKCLKNMQKLGWLHTKRGNKGGYTLVVIPRQLSLAKIISSLEGNLSLTNCTSLKPNCKHINKCQLITPWQKIYNAMLTTLGQFTLQDLITTQEPHEQFN